MGGLDKRVVPMLDHVHCEPLCEHMFCCVELVQHCVASPPSHKVDRVFVDVCHEEGHGAAGFHRARADVVWCEPHSGSDYCVLGTKCCGNFCAAYCGPPISFENCGKMRVWGGGGVLPYMCHVAPDG